jgi:tyrosinase
MTSPLGTRRNWASMSATDRQAVISGLQRVKSSGRYDQLTEMHQRAMLGGANDWHRRPIFLPVHRWFLTQLELAMGVPMPYWNWSVNRGIPPGVGGSGDPAQGYRVTTGPFANWTSRIYNTSTGQFVSRPGIIRQTATFAGSLPTSAQISTILNQSVYDSSPWNASSTTGIRNWVEGGAGTPKPYMHNRVHEWVGGDMRTGTSPNDPLFWFHHVNVDRIWASWQKRWGTDRYQAPSTQGPDVPMPFTNGVTPRMMFPIPSYDVS